MQQTPYRSVTGQPGSQLPSQQQGTQVPTGQPAFQQQQPSFQQQPFQSPVGTTQTQLPTGSTPYAGRMGSPAQGGAVQPGQSPIAPSAPVFPAGQQGAQSPSTEMAAVAGYEQSLAPELRSLIASLDQLANVSEWAESRLVQQGHAGAARACEDVHESAEATKNFVLRGSPFAASIADEFGRILQGAIQELQSSPPTEAREVLTRAEQAAQQLEVSRPYLSSAAGTPR